MTDFNWTDKACDALRRLSFSRWLARRWKKPTLGCLDTATETPDLAPDSLPHAVSFLELKPHHCCWPLGDPFKPGFMFCGASKFPGYSYCLRHCRMAYQTRRAVSTSEFAGRAQMMQRAERAKMQAQAVSA
jgi:hypothetical protein